MILDAPVRLTEILMALNFIQQSTEHLRKFNDERVIFAGRIILCVLIILNVKSPWPLSLLTLHSLLILRRFQGPYNGGSDRMGLLALWCLTLTRCLPTEHGRELAFGYLGAQLVLSYFVSGGVKLINPDWRSGQALRQVFAFSAYPVSEGLRDLADRRRLLLVMCWGIMLFEITFPLTLLSRPTLVVALVVGAVFHLANACLFGLNRFFWTWLAVYPAIIWLQARMF